MENSLDFPLFPGLFWFLPPSPFLRSFAPCQKAKQTGPNPALLSRGRKAHLFEFCHWSIRSICFSRHALNFLIQFCSLSDILAMMLIEWHCRPEGDSRREISRLRLKLGRCASQLKNSRANVKPTTIPDYYNNFNFMEFIV